MFHNIQEQEEADHGRDGVWAYGFGPFASNREAIIACGGDLPEDVEKEEAMWAELDAQGDEREDRKSSFEDDDDV